MTKTIALQDDAYLLIAKKQTELFEKTGKKLGISDIATRSIKKGINLIEE